MRSLRVLADDLTGACDIGAELLAFGRPVIVSTVERRAGDGTAVIEVVDTQTRAVAAAEAARRVTAVVRSWTLDDQTLIIKKIDTALRGHVRAEVEATIAAARPARVLVAAAIPEIGRTTRDGVQLIDGRPVADTPFAADPLTPVVESSLVRLFEGSTAVDCVRHLPLETIRNAPVLGEALADGDAAGIPLFVADAERDDDMDRVIAVGVARPGRTLVVGSIGAGRGVARAEARGQALRHAQFSAPPGEGILAVCGSVHPNARAQVRAATIHFGVGAVEVDGSPADAGNVAGEMLRASGLAILVPAARRRDPVDVVRDLGATVMTVVAGGPPASLALIGGETAHACLVAVENPLLEVRSRPWPLVVEGRLRGGHVDGMRVLSKGGSAGGEGMLIDMIARLTDGNHGDH